MGTYTIRRGTRRAKTPARDLHEIPYREAHDDGATIVWAGDIEPVCRDCGIGRLRWAEAGYVPWHRICDTCGSHWDLHPLGMGIGMVPMVESPTCRRDDWIEAPCPDCDGSGCTECEGTGRARRPHPERTCYAGSATRCAEIAAGTTEAEAGVRLTCACCCHIPPSQRRVAGVQPSVWVDGAGWTAIDPEGPIDGRLDPYTGDPAGPVGRTWGEVLALITAEHLRAAEADAPRTLGVPCVPACWARRARFYA